MNAKKKKLISMLVPFVLVTVCFIACDLVLNNVFGLKMSSSFESQLVPICCWIVMAVSLNLVVGISGELSLGHAGFMSVGAFTGTVAATWLAAVGVENLALRIVLTFLIAGVMAGLAGVVIGIPVLRLHGDYLAIVTLAFGEIIRNILQCVYVSIDGTKLYFSFIENNITQGTGILNGPAATKLQKVGDIAVKLSKNDGFIIGFVLVLVTLFVILNLVNSRSGRAIMAVRDNRIAAEATGINVTKYRLMAFVLSAVFAGMAGALYGLNMTVNTSKFSFNQSISVLVFVVLGGIGNMTGSIIAATVLTILPEVLRSFSEYRMLVYAIVLILVMLVTNNPTLRSFLVALKEVFVKKSKGRAAAAENGGNEE